MTSFKVLERCQHQAIMTFNFNPQLEDDNVSQARYEGGGDLLESRSLPDSANLTLEGFAPDVLDLRSCRPCDDSPLRP